MKKNLLIQILIMTLFVMSINVSKADNVTLPYKTISKKGISSPRPPSDALCNYYYDKNGNLTIKEDNKNSITLYVYDEQNRVTEFKTFLRKSPTEMKYELYDYGNNIYQDDKIIEAVKYSISLSNGKVTLSDSLIYTYDQNGNLTEINKWTADLSTGKLNWVEKTSFSEFEFDNCPKLVEFWELKWKTSWKYVSSKNAITYDSNGNKVKVKEQQRDYFDTTKFNNFKYTDYYYNPKGLLDSCCSFEYLEADEVKPFDKIEYFYDNEILQNEKGYLTQYIWPEDPGPLKNDSKFEMPYEQLLAPEYEIIYYNSSNYSTDNTVQNLNGEFMGNATVKLSWEAPLNSAGLTGYRIIFQDKENIDVPANTNEFNVTDVIIGSYFSSVQALYGEIGANIADHIIVQVVDANCAAPTGLKLDSEVAFDETILKSIINISWQTPQTEYEVLNYMVYVNGSEDAVAWKETNYTYSAIKSGDYKFEIRAVYNQGTSPKSELLNVTVLHKYKVILNQNNSKAGTINGEGIYDDKSEVTIKATANEGFSFTEWQRQVTNATFEVVSSEPQYKFTLTKGETFIAVFDALKYEITATAHEYGKISPSGISKVAHGKNLTYTITPDQKYVVKKLLVDNKEIKDATHLTSYTFENVKETHSIEVSFQKDDGIDENLDNIALVYGYGKSIIVKTTDNVTRQIEVSDISGKVIKSISSNASNEIIEIENPGVYIVRIFDSNNIIATKKLIIK